VLISHAVGRPYSAVCLAGTEAAKIESKQLMKILKTREDFSSLLTRAGRHALQPSKHIA
jgi:hypothetical protein